MDASVRGPLAVPRQLYSVQKFSPAPDKGSGSDWPLVYPAYGQDGDIFGFDKEPKDMSPEDMSAHLKQAKYSDLAYAEVAAYLYFNEVIEGRKPNEIKAFIDQTAILTGKPKADIIARLNSQLQALGSTTQPVYLSGITYNDDEVSKMVSDKLRSQGLKDLEGISGSIRISVVRNIYNNSTVQHINANIEYVDSRITLTRYINGSPSDLQLELLAREIRIALFLATATQEEHRRVENEKITTP